MTPQQRQIYEFVRRSGQATKKEITEVADYHYCNGEKHIGDRLGRMVKAGFLIRVKNGLYKPGYGKKNRPVPQPQNQQTLF